jgi:hypothetical protein
LSTVEEDVFQIIKKVSVEGHDVSESKVSTFFDDEVTVQEQDNFYEQAEASQSLYTKQIVNQENSSATSAFADIARSKQEKVIELRRIADVLKGITEKHAFDNMLLNL